MERPGLVWAILLLLIFFPLTIVVHKLAAQVFSFGMLAAALLMVALPQRRFPVVGYNICVLSAVLFTLSPIDIAFRNFSQWHVGVAPVIHTTHPELTRRKLTEHGDVENMDLVVYERPKVFLGPYWAIVVTFPVGWRIMTPL